MAALMSACVVVVVAMVAAINLALPELAASDLQPSSTGLLWIVDAYILAFGCLLIPAGALADRVGRKGVLLAGLGTFAAGCLASAAAASVSMLLVARAVTGLGAALVMPATLSLLLQVTPNERKPHAIATWSAATGAAGALGNLGGGLILHWLPWQGLFLVIGPLAALLAVTVAAIAPPGERRPASLDPIGAGLITGSVFMLLLAIIEGPARGWSSTFVILTALTAAGLAGAFVGHSARAAEPMLDPRLFRVPRLRAGTVGVAAAFFGLFGLFYVNAQYLQYARGYTPLATGIAILPLPLVMVVVSRRSVSLARRTGPRAIISLGLVTLAAGLGSLSMVTATTPYALYALTLTLVAAGAGLSVPTLSQAIVSSLPPAQAGIGSGLNSAVREVGAALGVATVGSLLASRFHGSLPPALRTEDASIFETLRDADRLGADLHDRAVDAFVHAMSFGLRGVTVVLLLGAAFAARAWRAQPSEAAKRGGPADASDETPRTARNAAPVGL